VYNIAPDSQFLQLQVSVAGMNYLRTDQYTYLDRSCPVRTDVHPADDIVEIVFGEYRFGGDTLRLVVDDPDLLLQLTETFRDARTKLVDHLRAKSYLDPALPPPGRNTHVAH
jgi:hypothetical protein